MYIFSIGARITIAEYLFDNKADMTDFENKINLLRNMIAKSNNIVALTGAGISVPSGIPDFRSSDGLYTTSKGYSYSAEELLSHTCFVNATDEFYEFYKNNMIYKNATFNKAHSYLKKLEDAGKLKAVITQNIDGLHTLAGSKNVLEFHGSIYRNTCTGCGKKYDLDYVLASKGIPRCSVCGNIIKPDVVLYEEGLDEQTVTKSIQAVCSADMLLVIGTSLKVYPAAGLVDYYRGNRLVLINKDATGYDKSADLVLNEDIIKVIDKLAEKDNLF